MKLALPEFYLKITTFSFKKSEVNSEKTPRNNESMQMGRGFLLGQCIFSFGKLLLFKHNVYIIFSSLSLVFTFTLLLHQFSFLNGS